VNKKPNNTLIARYLTGNCTPSEKKELERIMLSKQNKSQFDDYKLLWEHSAAHKTDFVPDIDEQWEDLNRRIYYTEKFVQSEQKQKRTITVSAVNILPKIAALFLLLFGLYFLLLNKNVKTGTKEYSSVKIQKSPLVLPDNSKVFLSYSSKINYPSEFNTSERDVVFTGEALFNVTHNPEKPFVVKAGNTRIKVLGTVFNLRNYPSENEISVYLKSGKILFYSVDKNEKVIEQVLLLPGEKAVYNKTTGLISKGKFSGNNFMAWQTGNLEFTKVPLTDVFKTLEKTYNIEIKPEIPCQDLYLTAKFTNETPKSIFDALSVIYGFNYEMRDKNIRIFK